MRIEENIVWGKDTDGIDYLINLDSGSKYQLYFYGTKCQLCNDEITENDVKRASRNDEIDISHLLARKTSKEADKQFMAFLKSYLLTPKFPRQITEVEY